MRAVADDREGKSLAMLGWFIDLRRPTNPLKGRDDRRLRPSKGYADIEAAIGEVEHLGNWHARVSGLRWLEQPIASGHAVKILSNGYPSLYVVRAGALQGVVATDAMPDEPATSAIRHRKVALDDVLGRVDPQDWLLAVAWDLS